MFLHLLLCFHGCAARASQCAKGTKAHTRAPLPSMLPLQRGWASSTTKSTARIFTITRHAFNASINPTRGCCAVVYVSEGRNPSLLDALADAATTTDPSSAGLIRQFRDKQYHRTGFTIGGVCPLAVARASIEVSRQALRSIDLRLHEASHPRIGVVDHISVHALGESGEEFAQRAGLIIATALGEEGVPVLLYGDLKNGRRLAEVRRSTPYFVSGEIPATIDADLGPNEVDASRGLVTVGCTPLVTNYNILLSTDDKRLASKVTRSIREKDGGLPWVESLTLRREDGTFEAACNLLRPKETTPAMVLAAAEERAAALGIRVVEHYETGLTEEEATAAISRLTLKGAEKPK